LSISVLYRTYSTYRLVWAQKWGYVVAGGGELQPPRLCVFSIQIQYVYNMEAPVFGSCMRIVLFHSIRFLLVNRLATGAPYCAHVENASNGVLVLHLCVQAHHVTLHLRTPETGDPKDRTNQSVVVRTLGILQDMSVKPLVNRVSRGVRIGNSVSDLRRAQTKRYSSSNHANQRKS
jgi:hypothetical protein